MPTENLIIGGGPVATNAIETIRQFDQGASQITLVSDEPAHSRMALPYWLAGQIPRQQTHTADDAYFRKLKVKPLVGVRVTRIDTAAKTASCSDGTRLSFDHALIATGSTPVDLPIEGAKLPGVHHLWTLADTEAVLKTAGDKARPRVVMIGSGFIGLIMLNAMYKRRWDLAVVEREAHVLPRMVNADAAGIVHDWLGTKGIRLHFGTTARRISLVNGARLVELADGQQLEADLVIIATGVQPNVTLALEAGIKATGGVDGGIVVNDRMQTNVPHIYAGGDVAKGPVLFGNQPAVHAIQPTAVDHGRVAGANMAGHDVRYDGSLAMNILDVCGLQCASFGNWSGSNTGAITICNVDHAVYRQLLFSDDQITGALFIGRATDMGMLTDVGMVKGIMQTRTKLGQWKAFLQANPFDIRRPYVATKVAERLRNTTLTGRPSQPRQYQFADARKQPAVGTSHQVYVGTRGS